MGGYPYNQTGGPYGPQRFGSAPPPAFNFKLPLIIAACVFAMVFLLAGGLLALNMGRRVWAEVEAAKARALVQAQVAQAEADRQARWNQLQAEQQARNEQLRLEQEARNARFAAEQQARMEQMRSMSGIPAPIYTPPSYAPPPMYTPPPSTYVPPPSINPPPTFTPVAPTPTTTRVEPPPPGFPATNMSQLRARDLVYVLSNRTWYPAVVLMKRGVLTRIRYSTNGNIEIVSLDRIRLEKDPDAKGADGVPAALRPVEEDSDEDLFTAKPMNEGTGGGAPVTNQPTENVSSPADAAKARTWTDATGQYKIEAELIDFENGQVQLRRADGKVINMPLEKLSVDDQLIVREKYPQ